MVEEISQVKPYLGRAEIENLRRTIEDRWITEGSFCEEFRERILERTGAEYAVLTLNGTVSLFQGLLALGIDDGDEVIVPDFTFYSSASSVVFTGAEPIFVDVDPETFQLNPADVAKRVTDRTAAIMPVHMYGQAGEMDAIRDLAEEHDLAIIEDAAQGFGAYYGDDHLGTLGDVGIISFYADKSLTTGEGGVVLTDDEEIYERLVQLKNFGRTETGTFVHPTLGLNFRFTDLQAAVGVAQLDKFDTIRARRQQNLEWYRDILDGVPEIRLMRTNPDSSIVPFRAPVLVDERADLKACLEENGIETRRFFFPLHRQPAFDFLDYDQDAFPVSNELYERGLCLPVYPELERQEVSYIGSTIRDFYA
ncbi:MAG: DegT/DnrJ/EryC1/StrS family aminotransferase [Halorhabdus sp.]